jgi:hypothetical protein
VKFWTVHIRPGAAPVLVREGFSWGAVIFGPLWLLAHRVWLPAVVTLAAAILILVLTRDDVTAALLIALVVMLGLSGQDLRRWSLDHRGYLLAQVVSGRGETDALANLLERRPDLHGSFLPPEIAR